MEHLCLLAQPGKITEQLPELAVAKADPGTGCRLSRPTTSRHSSLSPRLQTQGNGPAAPKPTPPCGNQTESPFPSYRCSGCPRRHAGDWYSSQPGRLIVSLIYEGRAGTGGSVRGKDRRLKGEAGHGLTVYRELRRVPLPRRAGSGEAAARRLTVIRGNVLSLPSRPAAVSLKAHCKLCQTRGLAHPAQGRVMPFV
ncbi:hypothetical protein SKAU_G00165260 [Synaphobranchus kaupii]|uniref:Uncharacterized protein n=1 Tax=Synaphobranchus kaupii TaxID=118154 RepID=A0A9Q1IZA0_SYNKA|nr:hypothetical protein SKAU_G00165260 [Synaphobranchus kaupii]